MVDVEVKNSVKKYTPYEYPPLNPRVLVPAVNRTVPPPRGASLHPRCRAAWQTRGVPSYDGPAPHGADVRSFGDILLDPVRWALSTKAHKIATATFAAMILF